MFVCLFDWMAAAAERTKNMQFITGVTAAVYRYNPAIIAQAFASLDVLYPRRIGLGVGTGEAMNEFPLGFDWPSADIRVARTTESIQIINKLWNKGRRSTRPKGEDDDDYKGNNNNSDNNSFVDFNGDYFKIKNAKLYTPPSSEKIPLYMGSSWRESNQSCCKAY